MEKRKFLADTYPELINEWHPYKNGDKTPYNTTIGVHEKMWWYLPYDDPETGKHFDFEWDEYIYNRIKGRGCPYLAGKRVYEGYNDLQSRYPEIAEEWHPTKNNKTPNEVTYGSGEEVWWYLPYDDPETGKHFDFEWKARINNRVHGRKCPYLSGKAVWPGYNDLATTNPELLREWHPTKNKISPTEISAGARENVWWYLPYDDPETGKHFDFEWKAFVYNRTCQNPTGCPFLAGKAVWPGYNDLATTNPELVKEWHPTKNHKKVCEVSAGMPNKVWWYLPYDDPNTGKHFEFEWDDSIAHRTTGRGCPYLSSERIWPGYNDLATTNPELAKEWHPSKNKKNPKDVFAQSNKKVWWYLPYDDPFTGKHFDFEWRERIADRNKGYGCPFITGKEVWAGYNDLATVRPELAVQWHPTKNKLKPNQVTEYSNKKVWWTVSYTNSQGITKIYEWPATISHRSTGTDCPQFSTSKTERLVYELLEGMHIEYYAEKKFDDCRDKNPLPFDIYIPGKEIIIELDGIQHFTNVFYDNYERITLPHDCIKNDYCKIKNIKLLRIPYIYNPQKDRNRIKDIVIDFVENGVVPNEIIDFYKYNSESNYCEFFK